MQRTSDWREQLATVRINAALARLGAEQGSDVDAPLARARAACVTLLDGTSGELRNTVDVICGQVATLRANPRDEAAFARILSGRETAVRQIEARRRSDENA